MSRTDKALAAAQQADDFAAEALRRARSAKSPAELWDALRDAFAWRQTERVARNSLQLVAS